VELSVLSPPDGGNLFGAEAAVGVGGKTPEGGSLLTEMDKRLLFLAFSEISGHAGAY
jgi:hypothetical protein